MILTRLADYPQERLEIQDLRAVESSGLNDWHYFLNGFLSNTSLVVKGFEVSNYASAFSTGGLQILLNNVVVFHTEATGKARGFYASAGTEADVSVNLHANVTNYVEADFSLVSGANDERAFNDPTANDGAGAEYTDDVATALFLNIDISVSTTGFTSGKIPLYKVVTNSSGIVTSLEDARRTLFSHVAGGTSPDVNATYNFPNLPNSTYARVNTPTRATSSSDPVPWQGGDKNITSLKQWMDIVMTKLKELSGTTYWTELTTSTVFGSGSANRVTYWANSTSLTSNANFTFDGTTLGMPLALRMNEANTSAAQGVIFNRAADGSMVFTGGSGATNGGNIVGYGGSHATKANYVEFRVGSTVVSTIDNNGTWNFGPSVAGNANYILYGEKSQNATSVVYHNNPNTGASAAMKLSLASNAATLDFSVTSTAGGAAATITSNSGFTGGLTIAQAGNIALKLRTNSVDRFQISGGGVVTIGAAAETQAHVVNGSLALNGGINNTGTDITLLNAYAGTATGTTRAYFKNSTSTRSFEIDGQFSSGTEKLIIQSDTTYIAAFWRNGGIEVGHISGSSNALLQTTSNGLVFNSPTGVIYPNGSSSAGLYSGNQARTLYVRSSSGSPDMPIVVSPDTGSHGLVIIRGRIDSDGTVLEGEGFSCGAGGHIGTGSYTITFTQAFAATPTVLACGAAGSGGPVANVTSISSSGVSVRLNLVSGATVDDPFTFIAIGIRGA